MNDKLGEAINYLRKAGINDIDCAIILGTGLGSFVNCMNIIIKLPYSEIPGFPISTVESHHGYLIYGTAGDVKVLAMQGRFHFYEGYSFQQVVFPVHVMKRLGVKCLFISNAAGGLNPLYKKGDLILIHDHINLFPGNPLISKINNDDGIRFPDMSKPYDSHLRMLLMNGAKTQNKVLKNGVYAGVHGPMLETRAEYRMLRRLGADMVGMSTIPEVIEAAHLSIACAAVSVITDECDPGNLKPVSIEEIIKVASEADKYLSLIFSEAIKKCCI